MVISMPLMDEFKEERDEIKNRSFKERMSYFWDYYKWHVIGGICGVFLVVSLIHTFLTNKDTAYYSAFINMAETIYSEDYQNDFAKLANIDLEKSALYFDSDMFLDFSAMDDATVQTTQKIMVHITAGDLDSIIGDLPAIDRYAYNDVLMDLRDFLTDEELKKYEKDFYYADRALLEEAKQNPKLEYPADPTDPTSMKDPMPVAIRVNDCKKLSETYVFGENQYFAVIVNSKHQELNHLFLNYLKEN